MADFQHDPLPEGVALEVPYEPKVTPVELPHQAYIEYRSDRLVGQLWPRGGLPEGAIEGPQVT